MKKTTLETVTKLIPDLLEKLTDYLKDSKDECLKGISTGSGSIAFMLKVFGQPLIDRVSVKTDKNKLKDFGLNTYLEAAVIQAQKSLKFSLGEIEQEFSIDAVSTGVQISIQEQKSRFKSNEWTLFFQPKYHPVIIEVDTMIEVFLKNIKLEQDKINLFKKNYYEEIETQIKNTFGIELYKKHLSEVENFYLKENETKLLKDNLALGKIGFKDNEFLEYETTYAEWKPVSHLFTDETDSLYERDKLEQIKKIESKLSKIDLLIDEYFTIEEETHLEKILFLVADFGKGKSVFLRNYCSINSKIYLSTSTGYLPIYFNLRTFKDYNEDHHLGVIANYLEKKYSIRINDEYFKTKRYLFLIDSLDECGELTSGNINKVVESIKKIQNLDPVICKQNKIIITSRPFDDGLRNQLQKHKKLVRKNEQGREVEYFISIFGFKKDQFNHWLNTSLKRLQNVNKIESDGLNKEILEAVQKSLDYDIYSSFLNKEIISVSELRRPIFAYMLFQLISNSISIDKSGKIGIYLSFLNLLTKEAKYVHDVEYQINLKEQFEARNILHSTAAIWLYNRSSANKSEIKKADVCRALIGTNIDPNDDIVLSSFKESGAKDIEFLSHSYFGESNNLLHFQHQSFAEILLAEYYLKVIIKFALDEEFDFEQARVRLSLGEPTSQTIEFFKELVLLFRDSTINNESSIEKRKLLFPLLASLATIKNNKTTYSNSLFYTWFSKIDFEYNSSTVPEGALTNWPLDEKVIFKICELSRRILNSNNQIYIQTGDFKRSLFDKEVFVSPNKNVVSNIDKWIILVCANILYNEESKGNWFNSSLKSFNVIFDLIKPAQGSTPYWARGYFVGINMKDNNFPVSLYLTDLNNFDFSNSYLKGVSFSRSMLYDANFKNCTLNFCSFGMSYIRDANFENTTIYPYFTFAISQIDQGLLFPYVLAEKSHNQSLKELDGRKLYEDESFVLLDIPGILSNTGDERAFFRYYGDNDLEDIAGFFGNLLKYGFSTNLWTKDEILDAFIIKDAKGKMKFDSLLSEKLDR